MGKLIKTANLKCSFCGSGRVRRSRPRSLVDHIALRLHWRRPFRCIDCYRRFYGHPESSEARQFWPPAPDEPKTKPQPRAQPAPETTPKTPASSDHGERRNFSRLRCQIPARVVAGPASSITGVLSDISLKGCFIETLDIVPEGNEIQVSLEVGEGTQSRALVRRAVEAKGMGVEFTFMTVPNFRRLQVIAKDSVRLQMNS